MKVLICTLQLGLNYGGILQAFALNKFLRDAGYDAKTFIDHRHQKSFKWYLRRILEFIPFHNVSGIKNDKIKRQRLLSFVNNHIPMIKSDGLTLNEVVRTKSINAIVIGSDQVWREAYNRDVRRNFFPDKINNIPIISYAASFGSILSNQSSKYIKYFKDNINVFKNVSVREKEAEIDLIKNYGIGVSTVCDPALLLTRTDYENLLSNNNKNKPINLLIYALDFDDNDVFAFYDENKLNKNYISKVDHSTHSIIDFLQMFSRADVILTDSYHGMVFSLIFKKKFVVVSNTKRGNVRFSSLNEIITGKGLITNDLITALHKINKNEYGTYDQNALDQFIDDSKRYILSSLLSTDLE